MARNEFRYANWEFPYFWRWNRWYNQGLKTHIFCYINNATWRLLHARNFFVQKIFFCIITVSELYRIVVFFRFIAYSGCISLHSPLFMTRQQIVKRNTWKVRLRKRRRKLLAKCCVQNKLRGWKKGCTWAGQLEPSMLLSLITQIFNKY